MIMVAHGNMGKMANIFKCSIQFVSLALKGRRDSDLAKKIRHVALTQYDGVEMKPVEKDNQSEQVK